MTATNEYHDVVAWLYALEAARGMDFKLERVALALKNLGNPHRRYACIHVAGTNGKGSIAAMVHEVLGVAGYRSGLYISPHLSSFPERIRIGHTLIAEEEIVALVQEVQSAATVRGIELTFFEFVTVMAFLHFARHGVEIAVIEVGLGGRLDATNVVDPIVTVISSIDLDHETYLGDTIESIAAEKCGIIKESVPVVVGRVPAAARAVIEETAAERRARALWLGDDFELHGDEARFTGMGHNIDEVLPALRGRFQIENAGVAIAALLQLQGNLTVDHGAIRQGLALVRWPGRLEVAPGPPMVIIDGAHNTAGIRTLMQELPAITEGRKLHLLFGVMSDKRWEPMVQELLPHVASAVFTMPLPPRGEEPERLAERFAAHVPTTVIPEPRQAFEHLLQQVPGDDAVLVTGSLFLVGEVYPLFARCRGHIDEHAPVG